MRLGCPNWANRTRSCRGADREDPVLNVLVNFQVETDFRQGSCGPEAWKRDLRVRSGFGAHTCRE